MRDIFSNIYFITNAICNGILKPKKFFKIAKNGAIGRFLVEKTAFFS